MALPIVNGIQTPSAIINSIWRENGILPHPNNRIMKQNDDHLMLQWLINGMTHNEIIIVLCDDEAAIY